MTAMTVPRGLRQQVTAGLVLAAVSVATAGPAWGQSAPVPPVASSSPADEQQRTALYKEGFDAATAGRWAEAKERFAAALAIRASAKILFSLAQAEEQLGQLALAERDYGRAADSARSAGESDVIAAAANASAALAPRVPHVRVVVSSKGATPSSPKATLDGEPIALATPVAVDPGSHRVVVTATGMRDAQATVAISERQRLDVPVALEPVASAPAPNGAVPTTPAPPPGSSDAVPDRSAPSEPSPFPWKTVGLVAGGIGVVGLGVGTYFGLDAKSKNDQSNSSGCSNNDCTASAAAIRRDAISAGNTSTLLFVAGGLLVAGGAALWLLAPSGGRDGVAITATPWLGGGGLAAHGTW